MQEDEKELSQEDIETQITFEEPGELNSESKEMPEEISQEEEVQLQGEAEVAEGPEVPESADLGNIQFEEVLDIDRLQNELNKQMSPDMPEENSIEEEQLMVENEQDNSPPVAQEQMADFPINPNSKKYVIYVEPYNVDYIESLSLNERKSLINKLLKEQNERSIHEKGFQEKKRFLINLGVAVVTFVIGFPIIFFCVNKAMEITLKNYSQAKINFTQLYKQNGKIKQKRTVIPEVKY